MYRKETKLLPLPKDLQEYVRSFCVETESVLDFSRRWNRMSTEEKRKLKIKFRSSEIAPLIDMIRDRFRIMYTDSRRLQILYVFNYTLLNEGRDFDENTYFGALREDNNFIPPNTIIRARSAMTAIVLVNIHNSLNENYNDLGFPPGSDEDESRCPIVKEVEYHSGSCMDIIDGFYNNNYYDEYLKLVSPLKGNVIIDVDNTFQRINNLFR